MRYKVMRLLCMFDLPTETPEDKRQYRKFRKSLIEDGFVMMQYSVYVRTCPSREFSYRMEKHVRKNLPSSGNVRLVAITEKQFQDMKVLVGSKTTQEEKIKTERLIIL